MFSSSTRVDVKIWTHLFNKILNLPIDFFERTPTGEIVHDVYEIYRVRTFLTSQLFGTLLDSFVLVIYLPIMFMVSTIMTACVLAICLLICALAGGYAADDPAQGRAGGAGGDSGAPRIWSRRSTASAR